jgi:hypothetical protein
MSFACTRPAFPLNATNTKAALFKTHPQTLIAQLEVVHLFNGEARAFWLLEVDVAHATRSS